MPTEQSRRTRIPPRGAQARSAPASGPAHLREVFQEISDLGTGLTTTARQHTAGAESVINELLSHALVTINREGVAGWAQQLGADAVARAGAGAAAAAELVHQPLSDLLWLPGPLAMLLRQHTVASLAGSLPVWAAATAETVASMATAVQSSVQEALSRTLTALMQQGPLACIELAGQDAVAFARRVTQWVADLPAALEDGILSLVPLPTMITRPLVRLIASYGSALAVASLKEALTSALRVVGEAGSEARAELSQLLEWLSEVVANTLSQSAPEQAGRPPERREPSEEERMAAFEASLINMPPRELAALIRKLRRADDPRSRAMLDIAEISELVQMAASQQQPDRFINEIRALAERAGKRGEEYAEAKRIRSQMLFDVLPAFAQPVAYATKQRELEELASSSAELRARYGEAADVMSDNPAMIQFLRPVLYRPSPSGGPDGQGGPGGVPGSHQDLLRTRAFIDRQIDIASDIADTTHLLEARERIDEELAVRRAAALVSRHGPTWLNEQLQLADEALADIGQVLAHLDSWSGWAARWWSTPAEGTADRAQAEQDLRDTLTLHAELNRMVQLREDERYASRFSLAERSWDLKQRIAQAEEAERLACVHAELDAVLDALVAGEPKEPEPAVGAESTAAHPALPAPAAAGEEPVIQTPVESTAVEEAMAALPTVPDTEPAAVDLAERFEHILPDIPSAEPSTEVEGLVLPEAPQDDTSAEAPRTRRRGMSPALTEEGPAAEQPSANRPPVPGLPQTTAHDKADPQLPATGTKAELKSATDDLASHIPEPYDWAEHLQHELDAPHNAAVSTSAQLTADDEALHTRLAHLRHGASEATGEPAAASPQPQLDAVHQHIDMDAALQKRLDTLRADTDRRTSATSPVISDDVLWRRLAALSGGTREGTWETFGGDFLHRRLQALRGVEATPAPEQREDVALRRRLTALRAADTDVPEPYGWGEHLQHALDALRQDLAEEGPRAQESTEQDEYVQWRLSVLRQDPGTETPQPFDWDLYLRWRLDLLRQDRQERLARAAPPR
ncbi:hypothetical protein [Streptomyces chrestomyceticus]|uniref:hypothetical protein n=1 Tax=Streptomyces chrestomyceticus TaxID=68185 RepID=UPI0019CFA886|nr:hypothetical protein [Streptomyces chrestomyceticus]